MSKRIYILFIFIAVASGLAYFKPASNKSEKKQISNPSALEKQGDICAGIADNAVANSIGLHDVGLREGAIRL